MKLDFSFWNYSPAESCAREAGEVVREWRELGITTGFSYHYTPGRGGADFVRQLIAACGKAGIRLILSDSRAMWQALESDGEDRYLAGVKEMIRQFPGEAVWGCYIGDEPDQSRMPLYRRAAELFCSVSSLVPFVNFFPYNEACETAYGSREGYLSALSGFAAAGRLGALSYDRYSQLRAHEYEPGFLEDGLERYFADLNAFSAAAGRLGLPLWVSLSSVGHLMYRTPTPDDIRWQIATAAAHGADCVQWFFLYQHRWADDYFSYPVTLDGRRTELFYAIAYETRSFRERVLSRLDGFTRAGVWHLDKARGDTPVMTPGTDPDITIRSDHGLGGIAAKFVSKGGGVRYLVVNSHQTLAENYWFVLPGREPQFCWLPAGGSHVVTVK